MIRLTPKFRGLALDDIEAGRVRGRERESGERRAAPLLHGRTDGKTTRAKAERRGEERRGEERREVAVKCEGDSSGGDC